MFRFELSLHTRLTIHRALESPGTRNMGIGGASEEKGNEPMKLNYFLIWLSGVDITVLLILACHAIAKAAFRDDKIEDERSWQFLLYRTDSHVADIQ